MFEVINKEVDTLVSQNVIPSKSYLGDALPYAFTEQGVAMLSSVLKAKSRCWSALPKRTDLLLHACNGLYAQAQPTETKKQSRSS